MDPQEGPGLGGLELLRPSNREENQDGNNGELAKVVECSSHCPDTGKGHPEFELRAQTVTLLNLLIEALNSYSEHKNGIKLHHFCTKMTRTATIEKARQEHKNLTWSSRHSHFPI